jgi:hypothetical protein
MQRTNSCALDAHGQKQKVRFALSLLLIRSVSYFGVPLNILVQREGSAVPFLLLDAINWFEQRAITPVIAAFSSPAMKPLKDGYERGIA